MSDTARETVVETIKVTGETLIETLKKLLKEGNIRRIIIKEQDKVLFEFPMTFGVIGAVLSPVLMVLATLIVLFKEYTITVERIADEEEKKEKKNTTKNS